MSERTCENCAFCYCQDDPALCNGWTPNSSRLRRLSATFKGLATKAGKVKFDNGATEDAYAHAADLLDRLLGTQ